ncbi:hypothetical protein, partial [Sphingorhabdus sp.]|uniref:hypothetical protein n=1 Tax=Sphingorhabdus sp. TaxID=1902408 RepID=UPI0037CB7735
HQSNCYIEKNVTDKDRIENLEDVLAQFLKPIRNLPFPVVVKAESTQQCFVHNITVIQDMAFQEIRIC